MLIFNILNCIIKNVFFVASFQDANFGGNLLPGVTLRSTPGCDIAPFQGADLMGIPF